MSILLGYTVADRKKTSAIGFVQNETALFSDHQLITDDGDAHLMTIAPTGSGKGRSNVIPTCLTYPGSLIVIDTKGEAANVTAEVRKRYGNVVIIDPFKVVTKEPDRFNPMDMALPGYPLEQQGVMLANAIMGEQPTFASDPFWDHKSLELIAGLIIHELETERELNNVRKRLFNNDTDYNIALLLDSKVIKSSYAYELIAAYLQMPSEKTRPSVLSTVQQYFSVLGEPCVMKSLSGPSSFDIHSLIRGDPVTIYLVIPPNKLRSFAMLLRLWIMCLLSILTERETRPRVPTLMILDEAANLGRIDPLISAITLMRGYGLRIWTIFQDIGQLKLLYEKEWTTMINNCDVLQAYGIRTHLMAKELAEIIGEIPAKELLHLPEDCAVMCRPGKGATKVKRLDYLSDRLFKQYPFRQNKIYASSNEPAIIEKDNCLTG
ncbi:MAG: type IV secretory system conjugative DNA transfer family protein [Chitinophagaceae bacterium]|nr:type IV secretory system conjugative DNA transfer family protein [Chitinophagaceae bacterium]MBX3253670.1 type IV secretory system conjugative DNA transfer family protein [Chitinophagaceae bacterium]